MDLVDNLNCLAFKDKHIGVYALLHRAIVKVYASLHRHNLRHLVRLHRCTPRVVYQQTRIEGTATDPF